MCLSLSADAPSPGLPGLWVLGLPVGFAGVGSEPGQQTSDTPTLILWAHVHTRTPGQQAQWPRESMQLPVFGGQPGQHLPALRSCRFCSEQLGFSLLEPTVQAR